ncbi:MAG: DUF4494 domain-containing protein [Paludibacter sp.]|nr:DUF4494 domain-containing protein [Paludibacter sp.]
MPFISGDFEVANIRKIRIFEMIRNPKGDRWYRAKVNLIVFNEESQTEKTVSQIMLVQATTLKDALQMLEQGMKNTMAEWESTSLAETPIMDVFFYNQNPINSAAEIYIAKNDAIE